MILRIIYDQCVLSLQEGDFVFDDKFKAPVSSSIQNPLGDDEDFQKDEGSSKGPENEEFPEESSGDASTIVTIVTGRRSTLAAFTSAHPGSAGTGKKLFFCL